jgi:hypothetical protein
VSQGLLSKPCCTVVVAAEVVGGETAAVVVVEVAAAALKQYSVAERGGHWIWEYSRVGQCWA